MRNENILLLHYSHITTIRTGRRVNEKDFHPFIPSSLLPFSFLNDSAIGDNAVFGYDDDAFAYEIAITIKMLVIGFIQNSYA